jgi:hypothetical protein
MPQYILEVLGIMSGFRAIPLAEPKVEHSIGLVIADRDPLSSLIEALWNAAKTMTPIKFDPRNG